MVVTARMIGSTSSSPNFGAPNSHRGYYPLAALLVATTAFTASLASSQTTSCESSSQDGKKIQPTTAVGLADESEEDNGTNVIVQDGMDTGSEIPKLPPSISSQLEEAELLEDEEGNIGHIGDFNGNVEEEDDDDDSKDEDTTCSICLINRQGPCRRYWLKFERCMKEHSKMKERAERDKTKESAAVGVGSGDGEAGGEGKDDDAEWEQSPMEEEWDNFMMKSIQPGEDDDDDDDEDDEDEEEGDEGEEDAANSNKEEEMDLSLASRCDKFMIPWIGCIQEHRNVYSLISNAFYQKDYIDPLEGTIPDGRRVPFQKNDAVIGEVDGYVMKFHGVSIDLGNWREHVEADADEGDGDFEEEDLVLPGEEPHLINAYAKFQLTHPTNGQPIEVAYIKDQKGRLLGFDSFTKKDADGSSSDSADDDGMHENEVKDQSTAAEADGECTFHIVPGETTSIAAYAIYRGEKKEDDDKEGGAREDTLYYTPEVPLPGAYCAMKKRVMTKYNS